MKQAETNRLIIKTKNFITKKIIELSNLETDKFLSKKGKKLFGGALSSRLEK